MLSKEVVTDVFVCTRVGLLPPGANPIAVNNNNNNNSNKEFVDIGSCIVDWSSRLTSIVHLPVAVT
jgi:hypothetical protein